MKWHENSGSACPVAQTSAIVGDRWTLLIVREALLGARSFDDFERALGVAPHILSIRLKRLVAESIMTKGPGRRGAYKLTASGRDLQPVILLMARWGNRWRSGGDPQFRFVHQECGADFEPEIQCSACRQPVGFGVAPVFGPLLWEERNTKGAVAASAPIPAFALDPSYSRP